MRPTKKLRRRPRYALVLGLLVSLFGFGCTGDALSPSGDASAPNSDARNRNDGARPPDVVSNVDVSVGFDASTDPGAPPLPAPDPADWAERSGAEGVTMATNFDAEPDVFDFIRDDPEHYDWERELRRSGEGSLKIIIRPDEATSGWDWWRFLADDMEPFGSQESGDRDEYWLTYRVYIPESYYNWIFDCAGSKKFSITSGHPSDSVHPLTRARVQFPIGDERRTGSSVPNEVVIDDLGQTMVPLVYRQADGRSAEPMNAFQGQGCSRFDFARMNSLDVGPQSGTPLAFPGDLRSQECRDWNAQFGPSYEYGNTNGRPIPRMRRDAPGQVPHPDPIAAGPHFQPGWNSVMYHLRFPRTWTGTEGGILEFWMRHPGDEGWTKLFTRENDFVMNDPGAVRNGIELNDGEDGYFHWGLWLTPFRTGGQPEGARPDTFLVYDEVIVSTRPIAPPMD